MELNIYNSEKMKNNTYVLFEQDRCIVIDPSFEIEKYIDDIESRNIKNVDILLTHGHYDHIQGVNVLIDKYDAMVHCSAHTAKALDDEKLNRSTISENSLGPIKVNRNVHVFSEEKIKIGHNQITVIATPGHTLGCTTYLLKDRLFTGDFFLKIATEEQILKIQVVN